jgi:DNA polymerase-3 subunit delta'
MTLVDMDDADDKAHPRAARTLIGHESAAQTLQAAHASGRLPHGWLISGPRGIGKATLAYRFARYLLSDDQPSPAPGLFADAPDQTGLEVDMSGPVSRQIAAGSHPDLLVIERRFDPRRKRWREEIVVDDVREMGSFLALTPSMGGWRVVIVDAADEMNRNAANAILKLLEEPPSRTVMILVSHFPGRLLPTIRSRCRHMALNPLSDLQVRSLLATARPDLDAAEQAALVTLGNGSIGQAITMADAGGVAVYQQMIDVLADAPNFDVSRLYKLADDWARKPRDGKMAVFDMASTLLLDWLAQVIRAAAGGPPLRPIIEQETAIAARLLGHHSVDTWLDRHADVSQLFRRGKAVNMDKKQMILSAFFKMAEK